MPRVILLRLTVTASWSNAAAAVAPERIEYTGKIGHIVRLQDGRLLTLSTLGRAGEDSSVNGPAQPAYVRYSGDQGYSWSKERIAFSFAPGRVLAVGTGRHPDTPSCARRATGSFYSGTIASRGPSA